MQHNRSRTSLKSWKLWWQCSTVNSQHVITREQSSIYNTSLCSSNHGSNGSAISLGCLHHPMVEVLGMKRDCKLVVRLAIIRTMIEGFWTLVMEFQLEIQGSTVLVSGQTAPGLWKHRKTCRRPWANVKTSEGSNTSAWKLDDHRAIGR